MYPNKSPNKYILYNDFLVYPSIIQCITKIREGAKSHIWEYVSKIKFQYLYIVYRYLYFTRHGSMYYQDKRRSTQTGDE